MRVTIAVVLTCILASQITAAPIDFRPGKEFVFHYVSQVVTGIPNSGRQVAGLKVAATVRAQFKAANKVVIALKDVAILKVVGAVPMGAATTLLPDSAFEAVSGAEAAAINEQAIRPIRCTYRNGMIAAVEAAADEPVWSANLKRGIVAMLQVNLMAANQIEDADPAIAEMFMSNTAKPAAEAKYFRAMEAGVAGKCEAIYATMDAPAAVAAADASFAAAGCPCTAAACACAPAPVTAACAGMPEMRVLKTWNYKNCALPPTVEHGILSNLNLANGIAGIGKDLLIASVVADYVIAGDARNFAIKKAIQMSKFAVAPYAAEAGRMEANAIQILVAVEAKDIGAGAIRPGAVVALAGGLKLDIPLTPAAAWPAAPPAAKIAQVEALLDAACKATTPMIAAAAPTVVIKVVHALRECPAAAIQTLATKYVLTAATATDDCAIKKRELLLDVLPVVPNAAVIPVVVDCVRAGIVSVPRAIVMLNAMILNVPATPEAAMAIMAALKVPEVAANMALRHTAMMGLGTITNKMYWAHWKMAAPKAATAPVVKQVIEALTAAYAAAATPAEKMVVLKACGNAGVPELLPMLAKLATDSAQPAALRAQAIYACRRIAPFARSKAMAILLPMFMNPDEVQDVRIAAFVAIMDLQPSCAVVHAVAYALRAEANAQVASFAYSYIATMAKATHPALQRMAGCCRHAMMVVGPFFPTAFASKAIHLDAFMESLQMGAAIDMFVINAPANVVPKAIVTKLNAFLMGQSINVAEVGVQAAGLDAIVRKLVGPQGMLTAILSGKKAIMDVFAPLLKPAMGGMADEMIAILKQLGIVTRPDDPLAAAAYMKMFGNEIAALAITEDTIKALLGDGQWIIAELESFLIRAADINILKAVALVDSAIMVPTPVGIPLAIKLTAVAVVHAKGKVALTGIASLADLASGVVPTAPISASVTAMPSIAVEVTAHMALDATVLRVGAAIKAHVHAQMPIDAELAINMATWKVNAKLKLPAKAMKIAAIEVVPICYVDVVHAAPSAEVFTSAVAEIYDAAIVTAIPIKARIPIAACGVAIAVEGQLGICSPAYAPAMPLCGKHAIAVMLQPIDAATAAAAAVEVEVQYTGPMAAAAAAPAAPAPAAADAADAAAPPAGGWTSWFAIPSFSDTAAAAAPAAADVFEPVTQAAAIQGTAMAHTIQAVIKCHGAAAVVPLAHAQVKVMYSADYMANQINVQVVAMPALGVAAATTKAVVEVVALVPNMMAAIIPDIAPIAPVNVMCLANIKLIQASAPIAEIAVKLAAGDMGIAADMQGLVASILPEWAVPIKAGTAYAAAPVAYTCTVIADISKVPAAMLETPTALAVAAASLLQPLVQLAAIPIKATVPAATAGHIAIVAKIIPAWQKMVVMIRGAAGAAYVMNMPIAMPMLYDMALSGAAPAMPAAAPAAPAAVMPPMPHAAIGIAAAIAGQCSMAANMVTTFDGVQVAIPAAAAACQAVLATDCSAQAWFAVTATAADAAMTMKAIKVVVPGAMFEVIPAAAASAGIVIAATVDGARRIIAAASPETIAAGDGTYVVARSNGMVVIATKFMGLTIATDCNQVIIQASPLFRGKICGLCGNFDGEQAGELAGPAMEVAASAAAFVSKYVIPTAACRPGAIMRAAAPASGQCAAMLVGMNQMKERIIAGEKKNCFTLVPVAACPAGCMPVAHEAKMMGMHCLPANKMSTAWWVRQAKLRVLHEFEWKQSDIFESVQVPTACAPAA